MENIVISAVNLVDGGPFTVLRDCLESLAVSDIVKRYQVVALVNNRRDLPEAGINYIEYPKAKQHYIYRLYYEYFTFRKVSKKYKPKLWLSLHDMSPRVVADVQAVYMHNSIPFYKPKLRDWKFVPINAIWAYLYKYLYRINIHSNNYLVVQQNWLREEFSKMFSFRKDKIIVAKPIVDNTDVLESGFCRNKNHVFSFIYPAYPRVFKNFDVICEAVKILEKEGLSNFKVYLTVDGNENKYSKYLTETYSNLKNVEFIGLQPKDKMPTLYSESDCLLFPSKLETWGLPLSEYQPYNKPIIVSDLPYAHESCEGASKVAFVNMDDPNCLAEKMKELINNDMSSFASVPKKMIDEPYTSSWKELFDVLLRTK